MSDRIDTGPIRERAQAAKTPGPYAVDNGWLRPFGPFGHRVGLDGMWIEDAHHIAGLDPTTVLALCDEIDRLRAAIERVRALVSEARTWSPYETRDIGAAYLEETVTEQLNDIEQALDGDSDV